MLEPVSVGAATAGTAGAAATLGSRTFWLLERARGLSSEDGMAGFFLVDFTAFVGVASE